MFFCSPGVLSDARLLMRQGPDIFTFRPHSEAMPSGG